MNKERCTAIFLGGMTWLLPGTLFALEKISLGLGNPAPGAGSTLEEFVYLLIQIIQWVALPALALCLVRAGYLLVSAAGDEKQIASGKVWLTSTLIGAAIVLGARVIADVIFGTAQLLK